MRLGRNKMNYFLAIRTSAILSHPEGGGVWSNPRKLGKHYLKFLHTLLSLRPAVKQSATKWIKKSTITILQFT